MTKAKTQMQSKLASKDEEINFLKDQVQKFSVFGKEIFNDKPNSNFFILAKQNKPKPLIEIPDDSNIPKAKVALAERKEVTFDEKENDPRPAPRLSLCMPNKKSTGILKKPSRQSIATFPQDLEESDD